MPATLGKFAEGDSATIDVSRLLETRMLIQANSGGGKSWAIRYLLEQTAGQVQQLVIDPEGEFATLREKYDFVIAAAHDGDALAHPRTAAMLARRLLETGVSAVLDIYDLRAHERQAFVRLFCDSLVNAPKALWRPCLVVLDEAHVFCPEAGKAESAGAVIDLAARGRKRGFALIAATQRLAKLHKDTAAELLNKLVGRTGLDVDVRRAADELGMTHKEAIGALRALPAGDFFGFGPALSQTVRRLTVGKVKTSHPKAGQRILQAPPKPTAAILKVLPTLADLPKEVETEARSVQELKRELASVRGELTRAKQGKPSLSREDLQTAEARGHDRARQEGRRAQVAYIKSLAAALHKSIGDAFASVELVTDEPPERPRQNSAANQPTRSEAALPVGEEAVLRACIQYPDGLERVQLTILTGYKRSSRDAYIARLAARGYVTTHGKIKVTDEGLAALPDAEPLPSGRALQEFWRDRLPEGERKILGLLIEAYPKPLARDTLDETTGYKRSSRDAYLARLSAKELVKESGRGMVIASEGLF